MITYKIGDLFDLEAGYAFKSKDFTDTGIPVLKIKNVKANSIPLHNLSYVEKNFLKTKKDKLARKGDILITMSGNRYDGTKDTWVGKVAEFKHEGLYFINQRVGALRLKPTAEIDISCCSYFLSSEGFQNRFIVIATSSGGQANLSPDQILNEKIALPSIRNQKAIGYILSVLDDKIKNNCIINKILEEMAQTIFRSWFVDFDPVHANAVSKSPAFMDTQTAALFPNSFDDDGLPTGWNIKKLSDIADLNPSEKIKKEKLSTYVEMANLPTTGSSITNVELREFKSGTKFRNGDTLLARITPCLENGKTAFVDILNEGEIAFGSTEYIVIRTKEPLPKFYSYILARNEHFREHAIRSMTGTSGRQRAQADMVGSYEVVMPSKEVALAFSEKCQNWFAKIRCNNSENKTLSELRDTLLPKIMSGVIHVKDVEREVEAAV